MLTLGDFEKYARENLPISVYTHVSSGADDQYTLNDNCQAFKRYRIRPRVLRDVSKRDLSVSLLGSPISFPIGIAPSALQKLACSDGEIATARAAASLGTIMIVSTYATSSLEEVARASKAASGRLWFQLYIVNDRRFTEELIHRAVRAGYEAIVVTVDAPYAGRKLQDERWGGFKPQIRLSNLPDEANARYSSADLSSSLTWDDIHWVKRLSGLPVIVKGIISGDSAREALANNVDGIIVSNHGGRQLDFVPAAIDALSEIVAITKGSNVDVYMDGGIRHGTDVLKALALGAKAVFIGRPTWWGLAYKGEEGVTQVLQILRDELSLAMALSGCASISDLSPSMIVPGPEINARL